MSINNKIIEHLTTNGPATKDDMFAAGIHNNAKSIQSGANKLVREGKLLKLEDGRYTLPRIESNAEYDNWSQDQAAANLGGQAPAPAETFKPGDKTVDVGVWKRKITAMLAKAERTENEHERDAFTQKAEKLMLRLGIHRAELEAAGEVKKDKIVEVSKVWKGNYSIAFLPFTYDVAEGFGHLTVLQSTRSAVHRTSFIVGPESQVKEFMVLLNSLEMQVLSALRRWQKENIEARRHLTDMEKFIQHRSFITGFGAQVARRLFDARQTEEKVMSTGAELVVANRDTEVAAWVTQKYPTLGKARGGMRFGSHLASAAGREAGKRAILNQKAVSGLKAVTQ